MKKKKLQLSQMSSVWKLKTSTLNFVLGGTIKYTNKQVVAHTKMQRISLSLVRRCESRTFVDSIQFFFLSFQRESALARKVSPVNL